MARRSLVESAVAGIGVVGGGIRGAEEVAPVLEGHSGQKAGHYFLSESSSSEELKLLVGGQPDNGERFGALAWWWPLQFRRELEFLVDGQTDNGERFWSTRLVVFGLNFRRRICFESEFSCSRTPYHPRPLAQHATTSTITMARAKSSKKSSKPKEMFKPYDAARVPDVMPFPDLARIATSKGEEAAVPTLNEHQHSWILDVGIRDIDLPSLNGKAAIAVYDRVKNDAFDAEAFKHKVQPEDCAEEARLPTLVAAWKQKHQQPPSTAADDADSSDEEEDDGGHATLLRGYSKAGWRSRRSNIMVTKQAIQKVISNKRSADSRKSKGKDAKAATSSHATTPADKSAGEASALSKLLGLTAYTGRDKFRDDRHNVIYELSTTLPGENAGGKFRKAEGILWAEEDQASWEEAAAVEENIDWVERQRLVPKGFKSMVGNLHDSRKFRPFIATMLMGWLDEDGHVQFEWAEAVPDDICVGQTFKELNSQLVKDTIVAMHTWAEKPLKEYLAGRESLLKTSQPIFPHNPEELDELALKVLLQTVTRSRLCKPDEFYDATHYPLGFGFASTGLAGLTRAQLYDLGNTLASVAGAGTSGFFRKAPAAEGSTLPPPPPPPALTLSLAAAAAAWTVCLTPTPASTLSLASAAAAWTVCLTPAPAPAWALSLAPAAATCRVCLTPAPASTLSLAPAAACRACLTTRTSAACPHPLAASTNGDAKKPRGKKRKAADQLVPEEDAESGRPTRKRKTPAEAQAEREEKAAAAKTVKWRAMEKPRAARRYEIDAKHLICGTEVWSSSRRN
ncbi:hypothetical protein B0H14DRAFT_2641015 [Mycena olivaceomarginata]|nr:hypothetical protein B0H14DRAFT_2641015 [Mycena olivaceomarginata]